MTASPTPLKVASAASAETGKSVDVVPAESQASPAGSSTMPPIESVALPPIAVEYTSAEPAGLSLVTEPSLPSGVVSNAPGLVGKLGEDVPPVTYTLPALATATTPPPSK